MLPVALAIADECAQSSDNLIEEDGKLDRTNQKYLHDVFFGKESSKQMMNIDKQQNDIARIKADNIRKSSMYIIL
jgi:hypothetical protein